VRFLSRQLFSGLHVPAADAGVDTRAGSGAAAIPGTATGRLRTMPMIRGRRIAARDHGDDLLHAIEHRVFDAGEAGGD
jgi:hypothetical protein